MKKYFPSVFTTFIIFIILQKGYAQISKPKDTIKFDLYYVCIGSQHYEQDFSKYDLGFYGFQNIPVANISASLIAKMLYKNGAKYGELHESDASNLITKEKIDSAINRVIDTIKNDKLNAKSQFPLLVFYFSGHGIADNMFNDLYMVPGNFTCNIESSLYSLLGTKSFRSFNLESKLMTLPGYICAMAILDCCYDTIGTPSEYLNDSTMIKYKNDLHEGVEAQRNLALAKDCIYPIIFSTHVGNSITPVASPDGANEQVSPICRRTILAYKKPRFTLRQFVTMLTSENLDTETIPAVTYWGGIGMENYWMKHE